MLKEAQILKKVDGPGMRGKVVQNGLNEESIVS